MLMTPRRARIYYLLVERHSAGPGRQFDAEAVYQELCAADERISLSTIQSILRDFAKCGLITRVVAPGRKTRYALHSDSATTR